MFLIRLLLLAIIAYLLLRAWRALIARERRSAAAEHRIPEQMVKCAHCELHLARRLAVRDGDDWYCCSEHQQKHRGTPPP